MQRRGRQLIGVLLILGASGIAHGRSQEPRRGPAPIDAEAVRARIETVIEALDSRRYAEAVGWDEHVALLYERVRGREPTSAELFMLRALHEDVHLSRGASLSFVLRGRNTLPSWGQCRSLPALLQDEHLRADVERLARVQGIARRRPEPAALALALAPERTEPPAASARPPIQPVVYESGVAYDVYYGYLHAHCGLSDGEGTPAEAYTHARDVGLDFFGLTDHGELLLLWPWDRKWEQLVRTAEAFDEPGSFVTLWGFEWSHPIFGHVNVINARDFTQILSTFWMRQLYDWIAARPEAFGRFNHPGRQDVFDVEFQHMEPYGPGLRQMIGMETWNGGRSFETYVLGDGWETPFGFWDEGNRAGWYLGPAGGQDNHSMDWGDGSSKRTAVLATSLARDAILAGYRARRFYATEDSNLVLDLRCQGFPMGARLAGGARLFEVTASDGSGDSFAEVRFYRNGELLETRAVSGTVVDETFDDSTRTGADYYYVIVRQAGDGDEALSSPIWIGG